MTESSHIRAEDIAAYVDDRVSDNERAALEAHFADCSACCEEIVAVRRLQTASGSQRRILWAVGGSAAVAAVLSLLLIGQPWKEPVSPSVEPSTLQRAVPTTSIVEIVSPGDGSTIRRPDLVFSWRKPDGEPALYHFVITTEAADSVWSSTTQDTMIVLPRDMLLEQGTTYLWYVDALLPDGRPTSTGVHSFRIDE
jgi:hypothetical protein